MAGLCLAEDLRAGKPADRSRAPFLGWEAVHPGLLAWGWARALHSGLPPLSWQTHEAGLGLTRSVLLGCARLRQPLHVG